MLKSILTILEPRGVDRTVTMRRVAPRVLTEKSQQPPSVEAGRTLKDRPTLPGGGPHRGPLRTSRGRFEHRRDPCMSRRTSLPSRVTTVALSGTAVLTLSASVLIGASGVSSAAPASPSGNSGAVSYAATKADESAFQAAGTNADPVACTASRARQPGVDDTPLLHAQRHPGVLRARPAGPRHDAGPRDRRSSSSTPTARRPAPRTSPSSPRPSTGRRPTSTRSTRWASPTTRTPPATAAAGRAPRRRTAGPARRPWTSSGPTPSRPRRTSCCSRTPPAETQGVQGLPNLMKAIDWGINDYPSGTVFSMSFGTDESAFGVRRRPAQFARFDQTFQRGPGQGRHLLRQLRRRRHGRRHPGAPADGHVDRPAGQLPERLALRDLGGRHPGAVRLDVEPDAGQAVQRRR